MRILAAAVAMAFAASLPAAPATTQAAPPATRPAASKPAISKPAATAPATPKPPVAKSATPKPPAVAKPVEPPQPPISEELARRIAQRRDASARAAGLEEVRGLLIGGEPAKQLEALRTLNSVNEVNFDHFVFEEPIRALLASPDANVRTNALNTFPNYGATTYDLAPIAAMSDDPSVDVRIAVPRTLIAINGRQEDALLDRVILKLLSDPDVRVRREALRATNNIPVSEAIETRMIELSNDRDLRRDAIHLGLTTRPLLKMPIVLRLLELLDSPDQSDTVARVTWSFRSEVVPEAKDQVVEALVLTLKDSLNVGVRDNCIVALGKLQTDSAVDALNRLAADPDQDDRVRQAALRALTTP